jgi:hypothetical protein
MVELGAGAGAAGVLGGAAGAVLGGAAGLVWVVEPDDLDEPELTLVPVPYPDP